MSFLRYNIVTIISVNSDNFQQLLTILRQFLTIIKIIVKEHESKQLNMHMQKHVCVTTIKDAYTRTRTGVTTYLGASYLKYILSYLILKIDENNCSKNKNEFQILSNIIENSQKSLKSVDIIKKCKKKVKILVNFRQCKLIYTINGVGITAKLKY